MARFWIAVASREHVSNGVAGGFAQVCHGKGGPLNRMAADDWIIYYSPTQTFGGKDTLQHFTAVGKINHDAPYAFQMSKDFIPWRRNVAFLPVQEVPIQSIMDKLSFIHDKRHWGYPFRRGCFEIPEDDFRHIIQAMGITRHE